MPIVTPTDSNLAADTSILEIILVNTPTSNNRTATPISPLINCPPSRNLPIMKTGMLKPIIAAAIISIANAIASNFPAPISLPIFLDKNSNTATISKSNINIPPKPLANASNFIVPIMSTGIINAIKAYAIKFMATDIAIIFLASKCSLSVIFVNPIKNRYKNVINPATPNKPFPRSSSFIVPNNFTEMPSVEIAPVNISNEPDICFIRISIFFV